MDSIHLKTYEVLAFSIVRKQWEKKKIIAKSREKLQDYLQDMGYSEYKTIKES